MDTDRFIAWMKKEHIYSDIAKDIETRCDTSDYEYYINQTITQKAK